MKSARVVRGANASTDVVLPRNAQWIQKARCLRTGVGKFWLPGRPTHDDYQRVIARWCQECPVRAECLVSALQMELRMKHTSGGIWGGEPPNERRTLRRKLRDSGLCITELVRRRLGGVSIPRRLPPSQGRYTVTLTNPDTGSVVYEHTARTPKGGQIIATREQHRQGHELVGTVTDDQGTIINIIPAIRQGR